MKSEKNINGVENEQNDRAGLMRSGSGARGSRLVPVYVVTVTSTISVIVSLCLAPVVPSYEEYQKELAVIYSTSVCIFVTD